MAAGLSRRDFIKLGTFAGISVLFARLPNAQALEVQSGPAAADWIGADGKARYRWDAIRKVTGAKPLRVIIAPKTSLAGRRIRGTRFSSRRPMPTARSKV